MFRSIRARELDPGGRLGARGGCASTSSSCRAPTLGWPEKELGSWAEADALSNCTATYSDLRPAPRSTIAAAFSPDGKLLASTHGDHTVKLIDCRTGRCVRTLTGHRRTPWVVRYHPTDPNVLASGSLDHQVRVWNATTAECVVCFDFAKPIASLAFHAEGDVLAVASGHKLYAWRYRNMAQWDERRASRDPEARAAAAREAAAAVAAHEDAVAAHLANLGAPENHPPPLPPFIATFPSRGRGSAFAGDVSSGETSAPCIALRTRRSLRAVRSTRTARRCAAQRGGERNERARRAPAARADQPQPQGRVGNRLRRGVGGGGRRRLARAPRRRRRRPRRRGTPWTRRIRPHRDVPTRSVRDARGRVDDERTDEKTRHLVRVRRAPCATRPLRLRARTPSSARATPSGGST